MGRRQIKAAHLEACKSWRTCRRLFAVSLAPRASRPNAVFLAHVPFDDLRRDPRSRSVRRDILDDGSAAAHNCPVSNCATRYHHGADSEKGAPSQSNVAARVRARAEVRMGAYVVMV